MKYRVLAIALAVSAPLASFGSTLPRTMLDVEYGTVAPVSFDGEVYSSIEPNSPLDEGYAMWDPLGGGCIDPASLVAWLPSGQRDPDAGPICLARPCARLLTTAEMEQEVLGRPLREGEWDVYTARYAEECSVVAEESDIAPDWAAYATEVAWDETSDEELLWGSYLTGVPISPGFHFVDLRPTPVASSSRGRGAGGPVSAALGGGFGGGSRSSGSRMPNVQTLSPSAGSGVLPNPPVVPGHKGETFGSGPGGGGGTFAPDPLPQEPGGEKTTPGGEGDGSQQPQPAPVPLPGSIVMLAAAIGLLRLPRR